MTVDLPLVSIGLPVFNGDEFLEEAIESLLAQTYENFELIVSDNASTDNTERICRGFAALDKRIRYYRSPNNRGLAWNYNNVFNLARGVYFRWAAHDDVCEPTLLARCVEILSQMPNVALCYSETILIDEYGNRLANCDDNCHLASSRPSERFTHFMRNIKLSNPIFGLIRIEYLHSKSMGNYDGCDIPLLAELSLRGEYFQIPEPLFLRRDHPTKSNRANPTPDSIAVLYDPENCSRINLVYWRQFRDFLFAIWKVDIPIKEKVLCYSFMARWLRWRWTDLRAEILRAVSEVFKRPGLIFSR